MINTENMTSAEKAREFTRTKFVLGNYQNLNMNSEMKNKFAKQTNNKKDDNNGVDQQKNNFKLGNDDNQFKTMNSKHYSDKVDLLKQVQNGLSQEKLQDLKSHHISYGGYGRQNNTIQKISYNPKEYQESSKEQQELMKQRMRKHHHDFTEDSHNRYLSQYHQSNQQRDEQGIIRQQSSIKQKSHNNIILGQHYLGQQTIQQVDYKAKAIDDLHQVGHNNSKTNYQLGQNQSDFKTINQIYQDKQNIVNHKPYHITQETRQMLRQSHFQLGDDNRLSKQSEQQLQFNSNNTAINNHNNKSHLPNINEQGDHFQLGNDQIQMKSNYQKNMKDYTQNINNGDVYRASGKRESTLNVGNMPNQYISENNKYQYDKEKLVPNNITESQKDAIRLSHLKFNDVTNNNYQSNAKHSFKQHQCRPNQLSEDQLINLKSSHFNLGGHNPKIQSNNQANYGKRDLIYQPLEQYQSQKSNWKLG